MFCTKADHQKVYSLDTNFFTCATGTFGQNKLLCTNKYREIKTADEYLHFE